jgi:hypothetical protein
MCVLDCLYFIHRYIISSVGGWVVVGSIETKYIISIGTGITHLV